MTLTKIEIAEKIQAEFGITRWKSAELVENMIELIKRSLESGDDVLVSGFGKFCVQSKRERRGRNPATGEDIMLEPRKIVTFRCSGKLRERINSNE